MAEPVGDLVVDLSLDAASTGVVYRRCQPVCPAANAPWLSTSGEVD